MASSSSMPQWKYEVFLSFRGEDTRSNFVGHLYAALVQKGIYTFIDDEELKSGKSISPELMKAIEDSRFAIIVFSKNYASSLWCLDELVKILQCKYMMGQTILPIFYNVEPSEVRNQTGSFAEAFAKHEEIFGENKEKVQGWRVALENTANLSGWDLQNEENGHEAKFIQKIVQQIITKLRPAPPLNVAKYPVGVDSHVNKVIKLLDDGSKDVRIVGIYGIGGIGKTTIAKAIFNKIFHEFESCCFLGNVRGTSKQQGLAYLQEKLLNEILQEKDLKVRNPDEGINVIKNRLRHKKVLGILDDVDQLNQLENLAGGHDWFGFGSRIIITTRDEHLLRHKADEIYKVEPLNEDAALVLFSWHAFTTYHPPEDYVEISYRVTDYAKGLPLALEVLGSFLHKRSMQEWESEINKLKRIPNRTIVDVLRISFDGLDETQKDIFLDIACFFKGEKKGHVIDLLESCGFDPVIGISVLIERSLISISENNNVCMHDLVQEMGKEIVRQESPKDPGKRSRLWSDDDIYKALTKSTVGESIEGIMLNKPMTKGLCISADAFEKMKNLRVLKISGVNLSGRVTHLSKELVYLDWDGFPVRYLPLNFLPEKLVVLRLGYNQIKKIWTGIKILDKLKILDLSGSVYLKKTPEFSGFPCLESLILHDCTSLVEVHSSIADHERLIYWGMSGCTNLRSLPRSIKLKSLECFDLSYCSQLEKFLEIEGNMSASLQLHLNGTAIKDLPSSFECLNLFNLNLCNCKRLERIPSNIWKFPSLLTLYLSGCLKLDKIPEIELKGNMSAVQELNLSGTAIEDLPSSIEHLNLFKLNLSNCKRLERIPSSIWESPFLEWLDLSRSPIKDFPSSTKLENLRVLKLSDCSKLEKFPNISGVQLSKLEELNHSGCERLFLKMPSLLTSILPPKTNGLCFLKDLNLSYCNLLEGSFPNDFCGLSSLKSLDLRGNNFASLPPHLNQLTNLSWLELDDCSRLQRLASLPSSILIVSAHGCKSLKWVSFPPSIRSQDGRRFILTQCHKLSVSLLSKSLLQQAIEWVLLSGSNIPDWFSYKSEGFFVSLWVEPRSCSKLKEIAICAVLELELEGSSVDLRDFYIQIDVKANGYTKVLRFQTDSHEVSDDVILFGKTLYELGPSTPIHDCCYIEASIQTDDDYYSVKKCGIHLLMEKEEEDPPVRCVQRILSSNRTTISTSNNNIVSGQPASADKF